MSLSSSIGFSRVTRTQAEDPELARWRGGETVDGVRVEQALLCELAQQG
jgi:hypothetical protein